MRFKKTTKFLSELVHGENIVQTMLPNTPFWYFDIAVVLWTGCFSYWIRHLTRRQVDPRAWTDCKLYYFLFYYALHYSSTLLVLMSIEKCFAVYFPLKAKTICTVRTAKWATGAAGIVIAALNAHSFFSESYSSKLNDCLFNVSPIVHSIVTTVDSVLYSFAPFALMFMTNFAIVLKFMRAKCKRNSSESTDQALSKAATRGTAMVVTVSVMFLILTAPAAVHLALWPGIKLSNNPIYSVIKNFAQYLNHSINGVLYCIVGSRFRNEFLKLFRKRERSDDTSDSHSVNSKGITTISETIAST